ncbi:hypothetical protein FIBSPDRAFT_957827 [Athelia psychrophila]|uniref:Uncharacterized protein n=1 Tax=Athelia psychrophila TaxID=1759441 RepID=A0A166F9Q0_9AGAM|nr:hypothetical protein FIBSPDRAFT_957827 [Fibularhizoctonia sp. CBS 109695]
MNQESPTTPIRVPPPLVDRVRLLHGQLRVGARPEEALALHGGAAEELVEGEKEGAPPPPPAPIVARVGAQPEVRGGISRGTRARASRRTGGGACSACRAPAQLAPEGHAAEVQLPKPLETALEGAVPPPTPLPSAAAAAAPLVPEPAQATPLGPLIQQRVGVTPAGQVVRHERVLRAPAQQHVLLRVPEQLGGQRVAEGREWGHGVARRLQVPGHAQPQPTHPPQLALCLAARHLPHRQDAALLRVAAGQAAQRHLDDLARELQALRRADVKGALQGGLVVLHAQKHPPPPPHPLPGQLRQPGALRARQLVGRLPQQGGPELGHEEGEAHEVVGEDVKAGALETLAQLERQAATVESTSRPFPLVPDELRPLPPALPALPLEAVPPNPPFPPRPIPPTPLPKGQRPGTTLELSPPVPRGPLLPVTTLTCWAPYEYMPLQTTVD